MVDTAKYSAWARKHEALIWLAVFGIPFLSAAIGSLVLPELVYDQFIWKHLWGPIVADVTGEAAVHNGVLAVEGYTLVSELVYGALLVLGVFLIYRILATLKVAIDGGFILALIPLYLLGGIVRVFEDALLFSPPLQYLFVSPIEYIWIFGLGLLCVAYGVRCRNVAAMRGTAAGLRQVIPAFLIMAAAFSALWVLPSLNACLAIAPHPVASIAAAALGFGVLAIYTRKTGTLDERAVLFSLGLVPTLLAGYLTAYWLLVEPWSAHAGLYPAMFPAVIGMAALVTLGTYVLFRKLQQRWADAAVFTAGVNLALLFSHQLDAWASYISIYDPLGFGLPSYIEKHPVSDLLLFTGTANGVVLGLAFVVVKFLLVIAIVYIIDILNREELKTEQAFVGLVKIVLIMLGLGPGIRDLFRVVMGV